MLFTDRYSDNNPCEVLTIQFTLNNFMIEHDGSNYENFVMFKRESVNSGGRPEMEQFGIDDEYNEKQRCTIHDTYMFHQNALIVTDKINSGVMKEMGIPTFFITEEDFIRKAVEGKYQIKVGKNKIEKILSYVEQHVQSEQFICCEYHRSNSQNCCCVRVNKFIRKFNDVLEHFEELSNKTLKKP